MLLVGPRIPGRTPPPPSLSLDRVGVGLRGEMAPRRRIRARATSIFSGAPAPLMQSVGDSCTRSSGGSLCPNHGLHLPRAFSPSFDPWPVCLLDLKCTSRCCIAATRS